MKRTITLGFCLAMALCLSLNLQAQKEGYSLKFEVKNYNDSVAFLAYRYGSKQYITDTCVTKTGGKLHFEGKESLKGGIYSVISAKKAFMFEILIDNNEQQFTARTDIADLSEMTFKNAPQNLAFIDYRQFVQTMGEKSSKATTEERDAIDKDVQAEQDRLQKEQEGTLLAYILKAQQWPKIPPAPEGASKDFDYDWFKTHYWDNFDFTDDRISRTPIYETKLKYYFEKMILQHPDSVNQEVDIILGKTKGTDEFYKQTFIFLYEKYNASEIVCMDKVWINLALNWYTSELAYWASLDQIKKIRDRAEELYPIQCGMIAPNMRLKDTLGVWHELHEERNKYTVLYFWEPDCSICKKTTPKLQPIYEKYKDNGVNVWGVCTRFDTKEWRKFIVEHKLSFLNISDNPTDTFLNNMRDVYDIYSTPIIYVLDEDLKIVSKRISIDDLEEWLEYKLEE